MSQSVGFGPIEVIATILIVFSIIKLVVYGLSAKSWLGFAKAVYRNPQITSAVAFVLAAIVLYFLIASGMTIVQILAVWVFVALTMVIGLSRYMNDIIDWAMAIDSRQLLKEQWLVTIIWVGLLAWGAVSLIIK